MRGNVTVRTLGRILQASWIVLAIILGLPIAGTTFVRLQVNAATLAQEAGADARLSQSEGSRTPVAGVPSRSGDLETAEALAAAVRIEDRFRETLDYERLYDDVFLPDAVDRSRQGGFLQDVCEALSLDPNIVTLLDDRMQRRMLVNFATTLHLAHVAELSRSCEGHDAADNRDGWCSGLEAEINIVLMQQPRLRALLDSSESGDVAAISTAADVQELLDGWDRLLDVLRRHVQPGAFDSEHYRQAVADTNAWKSTNDYSDYGLSSGDQVYVVKRGALSMSLVKRDGEFRLLGIWFDGV